MITLSGTPAYTTVTAAAIEIIARRHAQRYQRFFGAAFTSSGEFRYKEAEQWTEITFWWNTQNADPTVLYVVTYDGDQRYQGPVSRTITPEGPVPTDTAYPPVQTPPTPAPPPPSPTAPPPQSRPPTPTPSSAATPRPHAPTRPAWVKPVLIGGGILGTALVVGLVYKAVR